MTYITQLGGRHHIAKTRVLRAQRCRVLRARSARRPKPCSQQACSLARFFFSARLPSHIVVKAVETGKSFKTRHALYKCARLWRETNRSRSLPGSAVNASRLQRPFNSPNTTIVHGRRTAEWASGSDNYACVVPTTMINMIIIPVILILPVKNEVLTAYRRQGTQSTHLVVPRRPGCTPRLRGN